MSSLLQQEKKEWLDRKHKTQCNINKINNIKKITQNQTPWTPALCLSFLCLDATSSVTLLSLLPSTCSQGTEREASLNPCAPHTALSQHNCFRFTDDSGGACRLSETSLDRYWNQQLCRTWNFCRQVLCYSWLMLFLIWENSPSFLPNSTHFINTWKQKSKSWKTKYL